MGPRPLNPEMRFARYFKRGGSDDCWLWTGNKNEGGRGLFYWSKDEKTITAPRAAMRLAGRPISRDRLACHTCDNPACVNPRHIYSGTYSDNIKDAWDRGQRDKSDTPRGENHGMSKLTVEDVKAIRRLHATGINQATIARQMRLGTTTINNVVLRRTWVDVP